MTRPEAGPAFQMMGMDIILKTPKNPDLFKPGLSFRHLGEFSSKEPQDVEVSQFFRRY